MTRLENKIRGAFDEVHASNELRESTARFLREQRARRARAAWGWARPLAAVCAVLMLVLAAGSGWMAVRTPVSYVSIDVNPSVELALNRFDRVISATAYNEDGTLALDGLSLERRPYLEAIEVLLDSGSMEPYLTEDAELVFTVASENEEREAALLSGVGSSSGTIKYGGTCYSAGVDDVSEAHSHGMSLGKYTAWQVLTQYDVTLTEEECQKMTVGEIHEHISACQDGNESEHHGSSGSVQSDGSAKGAGSTVTGGLEETPVSESAAIGSGRGHHGGHDWEHGHS